jgi:hypothetical protein
VTFNFRDTRCCQISYAITWRNHEANSTHFTTDNSASRGILSNSPRHVGIELCHRCLKSCHEMFDIPFRDCINILLQVSPQEEKSIGVRSGYRGGPVIGPRLQIHLPECVAFSTAVQIRHGVGRASLNHNRSFAARNISSKSSGRTVPIKSLCH